MYYFKRIVIIFFIILVSGSMLYGQDLGAGFILGAPTGLNAKLQIVENLDLEFSVAWNLVNTSYLFLSGAIMFNIYDINIEGIVFPVGIGGGCFVLVGNEPVIGAFFESSISYYFSKIPLEVFLEIMPGLTILPMTEFTFNLGLGLRYWF